MEVKRFANAATHWVYNMVLSYVQNKEEAEEVTQDTIMAGLQGLKKFNENSNLKTWVYSIAINKSKDLIKYKSRQKRSGNVISLNQERDGVYEFEPVNFMHPGIELESKERMAFLFRSINGLNENQKTALILAKIDHKSQKEISEIMNLSPKAVESLLGRAKANLRKKIEKA